MERYSITQSKIMVRFIVMFGSQQEARQVAVLVGGSGQKYIGGRANRAVRQANRGVGDVS